MKCTNCNKQAEMTVASNPFCKTCVVNLMEKRVKKYLRGNNNENYLQKDDRVLIIGGFAESIIKDAVKGLPLQITTKDDKQFNENPILFTQRIIAAEEKDKIYDKIVLPWTAEHECCLFLEQMMHKSANFSLLGNTITAQTHKFLKLFRPLQEHELEIFAAAKGFNFARRKKDIYTGILDKMDSKYPESRFSLLKSIDNLSVALNQT